MDKGQIDTLKQFGYKITELPGRPIPRATYYKPDGTALINLPVDPYHLKRYLSRGFSLTKPLTKPQGDFPCETCGKVFSQRVALMGHLRSHKKES